MDILYSTPCTVKTTDKFRAFLEFLQSVVSVVLLVWLYKPVQAAGKEEKLQTFVCRIPLHGKNYRPFSGVSLVSVVLQFL